ncbi:MAG: hypothetical protein KME13_22940 [Myxacorys californica WJT36-NPBG1]|jgi:hypothetical protein|nr:hypothetical protein [Myxacorys californica WJT36-NPBG1]
MCLTYLAQSVPAQSLLFLDRAFVADHILQVLDATPKLIDLTSTFTCNGKKLVPDAVVFPPIDISTQVNTEYKLHENNWNDFGYQTKFSCGSSNFFKSVKIAYMGQPSSYHTSEELKPLYEDLLIDRPLPKKFYSYWKLGSWASEDAKQFGYTWHAMKHFNHIFCEAVRQDLWTFEIFQQKLLNKLDVSGPGADKGGVFTSSLFRGVSLFCIKEQFEAFVSDLFQFEVIDIKYLTLAHLQDSTNVESLKERSIRKQFVYEYLLHQQVKTLVPNVSPKISSHFWLPSVKPSQLALLSAPMYLDGYLKLMNVNLPNVLETYTASLLPKQIFD